MAELQRKTVCQVVEMAAGILDLAAVISDRTSARERIEWFQGKGLIARTWSIPLVMLQWNCRADVTSVISTGSRGGSRGGV